MREIPLKKRMEVLRLYFEGLSYDEISRKAKVSKGSVVNIVRELREGKYPEFEDLSEIVDELRSLAVEMNKNKISVAQAVLGIKFYEKLQKLGIKSTSAGVGFIHKRPSTLERWTSPFLAKERMNRLSFM